MRTLLIHAPRRIPQTSAGQGQYIMIMAQGLLAVAAAAQDAGHPTQVLHLGIEERLGGFDLVREVTRTGVRLVGFSLHWHYQLAPVLEGIQRLKQQLGDDVHCTVGGMTASLFPGELLAACPQLDSVIRGDGEGPFVALAAALEAGHSLETVPNLWFRREGLAVHTPMTYRASEKELAALDFTRYELLRHADHYTARWAYYDEREHHGPVAPQDRQHFLALGRGCRRQCADCGGNRETYRTCFAREGVDLRPPDAVARDIERCQAQGFQRFTILFDPPLHTRGQEHYLALFHAMERLPSPPRLDFFCWFSLPSPALMDAMHRAVDLEHSRLWFGVISFHQKVRARHASTAYDNDTLLQRLTHAQALGLSPALVWQLSVLDDEETFLQGVRTALSWRERLGVTLVPTINEVDPGSRFWTDPHRHGIHLARKGFDDLLQRHQSHCGITERALMHDLGYTFKGAKARWLLVQGLFHPVDEAVRHALTGEGSPPRPVRLARAAEIASLPPSLFRDEADWVLTGITGLPEAWRTAKALGARANVCSLSFFPSNTLDKDVIGGLHGDACRFADAPCPLAGASRWQAGPKGVKGCRGCPPLPPEHFQAAILGLRRAIERQRGCAACEARNSCSRCLFPFPMAPHAFCRVKRGPASAGHFRHPARDR